jgi:small subunit ribosomal protein S10
MDGNINNSGSSKLSMVTVHLASFDKKSLREAERIVTRAPLLATNGEIKGPIPLPRNFRYWCFLKSPHVNKKAREHMTAVRYNRLIVIKTNIDLDSIFVPLSLPAGVDMKIT